MNDTPETDGIEFKAQIGMMPPYDTVPAEFARRLERERDELKRWKEGAISVMPHIQEIGEEIGVGFGQTIHDKIIPELIRRRDAKNRSREIITKLASKAKEAQS
jgi:hypothetical protein